MWLDRMYLPDLEQLIKLDPAKISNLPGLEVFNMLGVIYITTLAHGDPDSLIKGTSLGSVYAMTVRGNKFVSIVSESGQLK
jgi:hypothetical protein